MTDLKTAAPTGQPVAPVKDDPKYWYIPKQPRWMRKAMLTLATAAVTLFVLSLLVRMAIGHGPLETYLVAGMVFPIAGIIILFGYRALFQASMPAKVFDEELFQKDEAAYTEQLGRWRASTEED